MPSLSELSGQAILGLVLVVLVRWTWELFFSPLSKIPGPPLAKLTDAWRAVATARGNIDATHRALHRKYGSAVRIGPDCISVSDPSLIRIIYATKNPWNKSEMYRPNDVLINGQRLSNVFNTQDEDWHAKYMKPIRGFWSMTKVLDLEPLIDETLTKFMEKIEHEYVDSGKVCAGDDWLTYFAWDVTANISFGRHYGFIDQGKDVNNLITDSTKGLYYFAPISQIPWVDYLLDKNPLVRIGPKPTLTGVMYAFSVVAQYQAELAEKGEKADALNPTSNVEHSLDKYLRLKTQYPDLVNDPQVVNWLMLNILAGGDTTSANMRAVVYYLSKNESAYAKFTSELQAADLSFPAKWRELQNLPYFDAVMKEAMRMNPGIAMIFERVVPEGGFILPNGQRIPAGTKIGINPAVTCRDFEVFGQDADEFNPDRWLQNDAESKEDFEGRVKRMRDVNDFVFGGGGRVCMGRYLATLEIWKLFATLYSRFDMKLKDPKHEWKYHNAWFVYQYDMPCVLSRRE